MTSASAPAAPRPPANPLLTGPVLPTLLKLAVPNVLAMSMAVMVGIAETYYIGILGTVHLAAMAVVFPFNMLTNMMSGGAMGGGVSSAVARALGSGNMERARASAVHACVIGGVAGVLYTALFLIYGPALFAFLGAKGEVLRLAAEYGSVLFCGAVLVWLSNTLASILRGTGNMKVPSVTILCTAVLQIALGGCLGLGLGPIPRLGLPGVALGQIVATATGVAFFAWYLMTGQGRLKLSFAGTRLQREFFADILKVGALALLSPLQSVLAVLVFTGLVARLGVHPLAGYGIGQRLEFLLIPIAFGIGVAAVPMVGMAVGAGDIARARRVAWTGGVVSAINLGVMGLVLAAFPDLWAGIFTRDPGVLEEARRYLAWAGPCFGFFGLGLTLYFASQGSGKILGPVLTSTIRLVLVAGVGTWLASRDAPSWQYFALVGAAMVTYGVSTALSVRMTRWEAPARRS